MTNCKYCGEEIKSGIMSIASHLCKTEPVKLTAKEYFNLINKNIKKPQVIYAGQSTIDLLRKLLKR